MPDLHDRGARAIRPPPGHDLHALVRGGHACGGGLAEQPQARPGPAGRAHLAQPPPRSAPPAAVRRATDWPAEPSTRTSVANAAPSKPSSTAPPVSRRDGGESGLTARAARHPGGQTAPAGAAYRNHAGHYLVLDHENVHRGRYLRAGLRAAAARREARGTKAYQQEREASRDHDAAWPQLASAGRRSGRHYRPNRPPPRSRGYPRADRPAGPVPSAGGSVPSRLPRRRARSSAASASAGPRPRHGTART